MEYSDDGGTSWTESDHHISTTSHTVTGLSSETSLNQFRVKATNATGDGAWSSSINVTTPDTTAPSYTTGAWQTKNDQNVWVNVDSSAPAIIKGNDYVRYNFQSDNSDVSLSGNAVLKAYDGSNLNPNDSEFDTVETTSTLTGNNAGDYYIEFQIAESEDEEGYLRISFTLSDSAVTPNTTVVQKLMVPH